MIQEGHRSVFQKYFLQGRSQLFHGCLGESLPEPPITAALRIPGMADKPMTIVGCVSPEIEQFSADHSLVIFFNRIDCDQTQLQQ
jgi:hypothetical protein